MEDLRYDLEKAALSLGFTKGYFMVDYIISNGCPIIIEMTPRPGGDSIPDLVELATDYNPIGMYLDFASGISLQPEKLPMPPESFSSINLYARKRGIITRLDTSRISSLSCVKTVILKKGGGDRTTLPPDDYDNRLIGYCLISVEPGSDIISLSRQINDLIDVSTEESEASR